MVKSALSNPIFIKEMREKRLIEQRKTEIIQQLQSKSPQKEFKRPNSQISRDNYLETRNPDIRNNNYRNRNNTLSKEEREQKLLDMQRNAKQITSNRTESAYKIKQREEKEEREEIERQERIKEEESFGDGFTINSQKDDYSGIDLVSRNRNYNKRK